jgi:hypothetical protein
MRVEPVKIAWHAGLPVFAKESFLKAVGDEYGWLGGFSGSGELRCVLPYTVIKKAMFRMVRLRVETIPMGPDFSVAEEKHFLNQAIAYFRLQKLDMIIPGTANAIFRTYPDGAEAAPYGTYVIDLTPPQENLWRNVAKVSRQNIGTARKTGVAILSGEGYVDVSYSLVNETFKRSKLPFMGREAYRRYIAGLGEYAKVIVAVYEGQVHSSTVYAFSEHCAYAVYGGNLADTQQGTMKLLQWEAAMLFKGLGVKRFDFFGARIDPAKGSKQEALNDFKRRLGATLEQGYMWKYPLHPLKYRLYGLAARLRSGGDIVDAEKHKLDRADAGAV